MSRPASRHDPRSRSSSGTAFPAPIGVPATTTPSLRSIPAPVYVEALLGVPVPRHGKIRCPFHPDGTPSLHVYATAEEGWFCFGCRRGGSIFDIAAEMWELDTRGPEFARLRRRLRQTLVRTTARRDP